MTSEGSGINSEILATLLRISERLDGIERLLRAQLDHIHLAETKFRSMLAALSMIAGNAAHDD